MPVLLFCLKKHSNVVFIKRHVYKSYLTVLIELRPNPGLSPVCETGP